MNRTNTYNRNVKVIPFRPNGHYAYPNQKRKRYYFDKLVDWALAIITSAGALTALLFLMLL